MTSDRNPPDLELARPSWPVTPKPMMDAFEEELTKAKVEWQVMMFGGAVHSFCDPTADAGPTRYDEKLCRKSYMLMRDFFAETL